MARSAMGSITRLVIEVIQQPGTAGGAAAAAPTLQEPVAATTDQPSADDRLQRLAEQRRALPDEPGVYLFPDARGKVVYVGKAKSIRKRVANHFSSPTSYGSTDLPREVDHIEYLVVHTEAEALL